MSTATALYGVLNNLGEFTGETTYDLATLTPEAMLKGMLIPVIYRDTRKDPRFYDNAGNKPLYQEGDRLVSEVNYVIKPNIKRIMKDIIEDLRVQEESKGFRWVFTRKVSGEVYEPTGEEGDPGGWIDTVQLRKDKDDARNIATQVTNAMLMVMKGDTSFTFLFRALSDTSYLLTSEEMIGLGTLGAAAYVNELYVKSWMIKDTIDNFSGTDEQLIKAIDPIAEWLKIVAQKL